MQSERKEELIHTTYNVAQYTISENIRKKLYKRIRESIATLYEEIEHRKNKLNQQVPRCNDSKNGVISYVELKLKCGSMPEQKQNLFDIIEKYFKIINENKDKPPEYYYLPEQIKPKIGEPGEYNKFIKRINDYIDSFKNNQLDKSKSQIDSYLSKLKKQASTLTELSTEWYQNDINELKDRIEKVIYNYHQLQKDISNLLCSIKDRIESDSKIFINPKNIKTGEFNKTYQKLLEEKARCLKLYDKAHELKTEYESYEKSTNEKIAQCEHVLALCCKQNWTQSEYNEIKLYLLTPLEHKRIDQSGFLPIHYACLFNDLEFAKQCNKKSGSYGQVNPIDIVLQREHQDTCKFLEYFSYDLLNDNPELRLERLKIIIANGNYLAFKHLIYKHISGPYDNIFVSSQAFCIGTKAEEIRPFLYNLFPFACEHGPSKIVEDILKLTSVKENQKLMHKQCQSAYKKGNYELLVVFLESGCSVPLNELTAEESLNYLKIMLERTTQKNVAIQTKSIPTKMTFPFFNAKTNPTKSLESCNSKPASIKPGETNAKFF